MNAPTADVLATREHIRALNTIRWWRSFFVFFALVALAIHMGAWAAAEFGGVLNAPKTQEHIDQATGREMGTDFSQTQMSHQIAAALEPALPLAEFAGRCSIVGLVLTMLIGTLVVLSGRLAGVSDMIRAMYVAIFAALLFVPWERMSVDARQVPGVFTTLERLKNTYQEPPVVQPAPAAGSETLTVGGVNLGPRETWDKVRNGARYAALPAIAFILVVIAGSRFGRAFRQAAGGRAAEVRVT